MSLRSTRRVVEPSQVVRAGERGRGDGASVRVRVRACACARARAQLARGPGRHAPREKRKKPKPRAAAAACLRAAFTVHRGCNRAGKKSSTPVALHDPLVHTLRAACLLVRVGPAACRAHVPVRVFACSRGRASILDAHTLSPLTTRRPPADVRRQRQRHAHPRCRPRQV